MPSKRTIGPRADQVNRNQQGFLRHGTSLWGDDPMWPPFQDDEHAELAWHANKARLRRQHPDERLFGEIFELPEPDRDRAVIEWLISDAKRKREQLAQYTNADFSSQIAELNKGIQRLETELNG